jgi:hypothetical protein
MKGGFGYAQNSNIQSSIIAREWKSSVTYSCYQ